MESGEHEALCLNIKRLLRSKVFWDILIKRDGY